MPVIVAGLSQPHSVLMEHSEYEPLWSVFRDERLVGLLGLHNVCDRRCRWQPTNVRTEAFRYDAVRVNIESNATVFGCVKDFRASQPERVLDAFDSGTVG